MTKSFFSALGDERVQQKLLSVMFDLLSDNRSPLVANSVGSVFKAVRAEAERREEAAPRRTVHASLVLTLSSPSTRSPWTRSWWLMSSPLRRNHPSARACCRPGAAG